MCHEGAGENLRRWERRSSTVDKVTAALALKSSLGKFQSTSGMFGCDGLVFTSVRGLANSGISLRYKGGLGLLSSAEQLRAGRFARNSRPFGLGLRAHVGSRPTSDRQG